MLLENKVAVIYGAGGPIGGAVARSFAREGARVFLAGRTMSTLATVAAGIRADGGAAETAIVDALDERAVNGYVDAVVDRAGSVDVSFNLISYGDVQQPLLEIAVDDFLRPIATAMRAQFLTTRAAARHMIGRGSGVILAFGGSGPPTLPGVGGFQVALDAIEGLRRQWACELGPHGIRVVTLKTGGVPEAIPGDLPGRDQIAADIEAGTLLNRAATLADVGAVAAVEPGGDAGRCRGGRRLRRLGPRQHPHRHGRQYLLRRPDGVAEEGPDRRFATRPNDDRGRPSFFRTEGGRLMD